MADQEVKQGTQMNFSKADGLETNVLSLNDVHKSYAGKQVLNGVNLTLKKGAVMGLVGVNGAGKTTLLKTALGLLKADVGKVKIFDEPSWGMSDSSKERLGFVPQSMELFNGMKVKHLVEYISTFYRNWDQEKAEQLMFDWQIHKEAIITTLSEGQKQRMSIILAMSHSPELLVLDEPVASLDLAARRDFIKQLIEMNADSDTSIIFSTHITSDIERVAADVAFLKMGRIEYQGGVDELKEQVVRLHIKSQHALAQNFDIPSILKQKVEGQYAKLSVKDFDVSHIAYWEAKYSASVEVETLSLEDIFLELN
jgi:ABC-2 type transport system ATP-binding protein